MRRYGKRERRTKKHDYFYDTAMKTSPKSAWTVPSCTLCTAPLPSRSDAVPLAAPMPKGRDGEDRGGGGGGKLVSNVVVYIAL